ncbi:MAG TPA: VWA domain-containing protein, partial [Thermoanaerobaculia bacterium]|nr:VWA domain-containing protein [Thermoanaerobaculia bacterium]
PRPAVPIAARRHFLLLFDLSFSEPSSIVKARQAAKDLVLKSLTPADLVAVATYAASGGAKLVLGFTSDRYQIEVAVDTLGLPQLVDREPDPLGVMLTSSSSDLPASAMTGGGGAAAAEAMAAVKTEILDQLQVFAQAETQTTREVQKNRVTAFTRSMGDLARVMNSVQGRKHVVYLSEGFDSSLILGTTDAQAINDTNAAVESGEVWKVDSEQRYGSTKTGSDLTKMFEEFRRADCTIQAVDIGGLRAAGSQAPGRASGEESLFMMANETGGELYRNFNNLSDAMAKLLERTSVTYVLSFQPANLAVDGKYHQLKVKLKNDRGMRVVFRPGYYAPRPYAQQSRLERQLAAAGLMLGGAPGGKIATSVLAPAFEVAGQKAYVPVLIEVDGAGLLNGAKDVAQAEIYAYAMDNQGAIQDHFGQNLGLDLKKVRAALQQGGLKFYGHLDLAPGQYVVRVVVRNGQSGEASVSAVPVTVPAADQRASLLPPLFPDAAGKWLIIRESGGREKLRDLPYPFMLNDAPFVPAARPVVPANSEASLYLMGYGLGKGALEVEGQVFGQDGSQKSGAQMALRSRSGAGAAGLTGLVASFRPGGLAAGDYTLVVTVVDPASHQRQSSSIPFVVPATGGSRG